MKKLNKKYSKKKHTANTLLHEENEMNASNKVHNVKKSKVKQMGRQKKVSRFNVPGSGLTKWMLK